MHGVNMRLGVDLLLPTQEDEQVTPEEHALKITKRLAAAHQEATDRTRLMQEANKAAHDRNVQEPIYQPGDLVWLMTPQVKNGFSKKLTLRYCGPYYIAAKVGNHTFMLRHQKTNRVLSHPINAERLKPFVDRRDFKSVPGTQVEEEEQPSSSGPSDENTSTDKQDAENTGRTEEWHAVNKLLAVKKIGGQTFFRVEWADQTCKPTWIPENDITEALKRAFYVNRTKAGRKRRRRK